jgi:hypothetical protein
VKRYALLFLVLLNSGFLFAGAPISKFRTDLASLLHAANTVSGFDSLKGTELSLTEWTCNQELDGFITTVREQQNPLHRLYITAQSVQPVAGKHIDVLVKNGLAGYQKWDSDKDKSVVIDRTYESRKLVFTRSEKNTDIIVTIKFLAHTDNSVELTVESR